MVRSERNSPGVEILYMVPFAIKMVFVRIDPASFNKVSPVIQLTRSYKHEMRLFLPQHLLDQIFRFFPNIPACEGIKSRIHKNRSAESVPSLTPPWGRPTAISYNYHYTVHIETHNTFRGPHESGIPTPAF